MAKKFFKTINLSEKWIISRNKGEDTEKVKKKALFKIYIEINRTILKCVWNSIPPYIERSESITVFKQDYDVFVNRVRCLTFGHLNVRSLLPRIDEIRCILNSHNFDVFAVCESWLNHTITDCEIAVNGYEVHRKDRQNSIGGGACLIVRMITFTVSSDLMFDDVEALCVS